MIAVQRGRSWVLIGVLLITTGAAATYSSTHRPGVAASSGARSAATGTSCPPFKISATHRPAALPALTTTPASVPPGADLVWTTAAGVFVGGSGIPAVRLASTPPGGFLDNLTVDSSSTMVAWTTFMPGPIDQAIVIIDLTTGTRLSWSASQFRATHAPGEYPDLLVLAPGEPGIVMVYNDNLVQVLPGGTIRQQPFRLTPNRDSLIVRCSYGAPIALGQFDHTTILEDWAPMQNGWSDLYELSDSGEANYLYTDNGNRPVDNIVIDAASGRLVFDDNVIGDPCDSVAVLQSAPLATSTPDQITLPTDSSFESGISSLTSNAGRILVTSWQSDRPRCSPGNVTESASTYQLTGSKVTDLDIPAQWAEAGPNGSLAYIDPSSQLVIRSSTGAEQTLATGTSTAAWIMPS